MPAKSCASYLPHIFPPAERRLRAVRRGGYKGNDIVFTTSYSFGLSDIFSHMFNYTFVIPADVPFYPMNSSALILSDSWYIRGCCSDQLPSLLPR